MTEAHIIRNNGIEQIKFDDPNKLQKYVEDCINEAAKRLKDHNLVKDNPLEYVLKKIIGYDLAYDPNWLPHAAFAKENLADSQTALKFIAEHYEAFQECVDHMADGQGHDMFYKSIFSEGFDIPRLVTAVYVEIAHAAGISAEVID